MKKKTQERENINHQAYMDVLNCEEPQSDDEYYMKCYRNWRPLQKFPSYLCDDYNHY